MNTDPNTVIIIHYFIVLQSSGGATANSSGNQSSSGGMVRSSSAGAGLASAHQQTAGGGGSGVGTAPHHGQYQNSGNSGGAGAGKSWSSVTTKGLPFDAERPPPSAGMFVYTITMTTGSCLVWVRPCEGFQFTMVRNLKRVEYKTR